MRQDGGRSSTTWRPNPDLAQSFTECHVGVGAAAGQLMVRRTAIAAQSRETGDGGVQELGWGAGNGSFDARQRDERTAQ
jgi:hypothetical protein